MRDKNLHETFQAHPGGRRSRAVSERNRGLGDASAMVTGRQDKIAVQREALAIPLRGLRRSQIHGRKRSNVHESCWTSASAQFSHARRAEAEAQTVTAIARIAQAQAREVA